MRIAVLGCGSIGRRHIKNLHGLGYRDLLAFDPDLGARRKTESLLEGPMASNLEEVWRGAPEVALVTATTEVHVDLAMAAVDHGCHLFIEKPLYHVLQPQLTELLRRVAERKLVNMCACNMRFHPGPKNVKALLDEGSIGQVLSARLQTGSYLPRWQADQDYLARYSASPEWGGAILDCIHEIDLALWYFGSARVLGSAMLPAQSIGLETDGLAEILMRHRTGVLTSVHVNFVQRDYSRSCQIVGSKGSVYWDFNDGQVKVYGEDGCLTRCIREPQGWQLNQMYVDELEHFLQAVELRGPTTNPISGGVEALELALTVKSGEVQTLA